MQCSRPTHWMLHEPQETSEDGSPQNVMQLMVGETHGKQVPDWQTLPKAQMLPHAPQFCSSSFLVTQEPLQHDCPGHSLSLVQPGPPPPEPLEPPEDELPPELEEPPLEVEPPEDVLPPEDVEPPLEVEPPEDVLPPLPELAPAPPAPPLPMTHVPPWQMSLPVQLCPQAPQLLSSLLLSEQT